MKHIFAFVAGVSIGSLATWLVVKNKYEKIAQEEIEVAREYFSKKENPCEDNQETETEPAEEFHANEEYAAVLKDLGYGEDEDEEYTSDTPYVIAPNEFGKFEYDAISLTYYADGVLTDDYDEFVENPDDVVGKDYADHFGEYMDDVVHVRNDVLKCDYEISRDLRKYSDLYPEGDY